MSRPLMFRSIAFLAAFFCSGCLHVTVTTTVSADGSCDRTVTFTSNERKVPPNRIPIPVDSTWKIEWVVRSDSGDRYEYRATKHFRSGEELTASCPVPTDTDGVRVLVSIERQFQWFYTYMEYRECFSTPRTYTLAPRNAFFTPEEGERYARGESDSLVEEKVMRWEARNAFEVYMNEMARALRLRPNGNAEAQQFLSVRDSLFPTVFNAINGKTHFLDSTEERLDFFARAARVPAIRTLRAADDSAGKHVDLYAKSFSGPNGSRTNIIRMPGLLIDANSSKVSASTVTWSIDLNRLYVADAVMTARSRVVNPWAWWITGTAALILVLLVIVRRFAHPR